MSIIDVLAMRKRELASGAERLTGILKGNPIELREMLPIEMVGGEAC